ncbi:MAG: hypothetical protein PVJ02_06220 [Gemmatimonadota bacterium]|jgi:hypothetical protein
MATLSERRRSVAFLDHEDETWACFLVTYAQTQSRWSGYFSFRSGEGDETQEEIRTADIFLEASEGEIHEKARGLGRPLLRGLLASALHTARRRSGGPGLRKQFRELLSENARELAGTWPEEDHAPPDERDRLRSLYASYRLDQVTHLISLVDSGAFESAVDRILDGERVDFRVTDRIQFAMMVVEHIEKLLPLPPFEVWVEDFLAHRDAYRLYAHTLHREGRLP